MLSPLRHLAIGLLAALIPAGVAAQSGADSTSTATVAPAADATAGAAHSEKNAGVPPVVHSQIGDSATMWGGRLKIINIGKRQQHNYSDRATLDSDILSPKSVNFSPDGKSIYVNSLEGGKTVVYAVPSLKKLATISHNFAPGDDNLPLGVPLWAKPSGYYRFTHYTEGASRPFMGKPVEGTFSHNGRYFWAPYYRRTFDINAQDPSAVAVIDTRTHRIVRMFETGPLPKMIAADDSLGLVAITHWGDNTVGLIDVTGDMENWHHLPPMVAGSQVKLDFPLDHQIDRDANSGVKLRGTIFTPDGRYLLVSAMGGPMQVFDVAARKYLGRVNSGYGIRHLVIANGRLYGSKNMAASVAEVPLDSVYAGIRRAVASDSRDIRINGWRECKVGGGARTLEASPDGALLFVACNSGSCVSVVDAAGMKLLGEIRADSYPVGLALSPDGKYMAVTSQGRKGFGGNALNLYSIYRADHPGGFPVRVAEPTDSAAVAATPQAPAEPTPELGMSPRMLATIICFAVGALIAGICVSVAVRKRQNKRKRNDIKH